MAYTKRNFIETCAVLALFSPLAAFAFNSGSTGADGAFNPTVNTELQVPASGVFNFTTVNIPSNVTVRFKKNVTNTPVTILTSGNVTIDGTLDVSGGKAADVGTAGDGNLGDDGQPGIGGSGGYDGGRGSLVGCDKSGGAGVGPGGGPGGRCVINQFSEAGGGGSFATQGTAGGQIQTAPPYGSATLLPLVGGSGGGGGSSTPGGSNFGGSGGGGGGGALLIASSGTVAINGSILSVGGDAGEVAGTGVGNRGGGGSGGAIRVVATSISGFGETRAHGGLGGFSSNLSGGDGRIRMEAENFTYTGQNNPQLSFAAPGNIFVAGFPTLRITSIGGQAVPANPTGNADVTLPASITNPVTVEFATTGVPTGNTIKLTVTPAYGEQITAVSPALTGTTANGAASVSVSLPNGPSKLAAATTYTIIASLGDAMSKYAQGERVEKIRVAADMKGRSTVTLITVSGKEYAAPKNMPMFPG